MRSDQIVPERSCLMRPLLLLMSTGSISLYQVISGSGFPLAAHSMVAVLVFSTTFSWGPISIVGKPWGIWVSERFKRQIFEYIQSHVEQETVLKRKWKEGDANTTQIFVRMGSSGCERHWVHQSCWASTDRKEDEQEQIHFRCSRLHSNQKAHKHNKLAQQHCYCRGTGESFGFQICLRKVSDRLSQQAYFRFRQRKDSNLFLGTHA